MPEIMALDPRSKQEPSSFDYETTDHCDDSRCTDKPPQAGIMHHARGATGRICEVLFLCHAHESTTDTEQLNS